MIKSLLICDDVPNADYGTGQRLLGLKEALSELGECRLLFLSHEKTRPRGLEEHDFVAPSPFDYRSSSWQWTWRHLTFREYRADPRYDSILRGIRAQYSYDLALCSFFRTTCVAPTSLVPCFVDIDALPEPSGKVERTIWPLTKWMMRKRVQQFHGVFVIRASDRKIFDSCKAVFLPGISATARPVDPTAQRKRQVLFVGSMRWAPNLAAVEAMLSLGIPEALHRHGYALRLVGEGTERFGERPGLSSGGFVDDIHLEYSESELVICPVKAGAGANIKLAEAVQSGCAVLASTHSAAAYEGVLHPGVHLEVFDDYPEFLKTLVMLLSDDERLMKLRAECRLLSGARMNKGAIKDILKGEVLKAFSGYIPRSAEDGQMHPREI